MNAAAETPGAPEARGAPARRRVPSARARAREAALQGLYRWLLTREEPEQIASDLAGADSFGRVDGPYFRNLLAGAVAQAGEIEAACADLLDRPAAQLSPVERGILLLAGFELRHQPDVPYRVVINEAIELAKRYGGTDGHKYVNGVLDRLAPRLRPEEVGAGRRGTPPARRRGP
jgi:N utilization substance protein B